MVGPDGDADGFEVNRTDLDKHAAQVDRFASRVGKAATIIDTEGLGGVDIYGALCSPLMMTALHIFFGDTKDMLDRLAGLGHSMADGVRTNSANYASAEDAVHGRIGEVK